MPTTDNISPRGTESISSSVMMKTSLAQERYYQGGNNKSSETIWNTLTNHVTNTHIVVQSKGGDSRDVENNISIQELQESDRNQRYNHDDICLDTKQYSDSLQGSVMSRVTVEPDDKTAEVSNAINPLLTNTYFELSKDLHSRDTEIDELLHKEQEIKEQYEICSHENIK